VAVQLWAMGRFMLSTHQVESTSSQRVQARAQRIGWTYMSGGTQEHALNMQDDRAGRFSSRTSTTLPFPSQYAFVHIGYLT
jgi:hypothetical protein